MSASLRRNLHYAVSEIGVAQCSLEPQESVELRKRIFIGKVAE